MPSRIKVTKAQVHIWSCAHTLSIYVPTQVLVSAILTLTPAWCPVPQADDMEKGGRGREGGREGGREEGKLSMEGDK